MIRFDTIVFGSLFIVSLIFYLLGFEVPIELVIVFFTIPVLMYIISLEIVNYYLYQFFGIGKWINPIIKLSILLIKLDGVEKLGETKRIISYLNNEFEPETAKVKLIYYKKQFNKSHNLEEIFERINYSTNTSNKVRILQHLIKIALSDRLLSDKEEKFIKMVAQRMSIPQFTLKAILALHTYVTEQDIKNQRLRTPNSSSYRVSKAYQVLGLDDNASFEEVKEAHRELVKIYHPDKLLKSEKNKEFAKQQFQAITDAYNLLKQKLA